jgi:predicted nucleotidyltransferase component of viral defense system
MILPEEIRQKATEYNLQPTDVQKDYVHSWILHCIYAASPLGSQLILKGGNALRKTYLPDTRFSKDLDFSLEAGIDAGFLRDELNKVCEAVGEKTKINFELDKTSVKEKDLAAANINALEARAYFRGFNGDDCITLKVQLDVTPFDHIYLPVQNRPLIHPYSDLNLCATNIKCQKIEEILASKLNVLFHRRKVSDMFDLLHGILFNKNYSVARSEVITTFLKKSIFENNPSAAKQSLLNTPLEDFRPLWPTLVAPVSSLFGFEQVLNNFRNLIDSLFALVPAAVPSFRGGFGMSGGFNSSNFFPSNFRNAIISGGKTQTMIEMVYDGYRRLVEPYAIEYYTRKKDGVGSEYFWGYYTSGGKSGKVGIKRFFCDQIERVENTAEHFQPQWPIEL